MATQSVCPQSSSSVTVAEKYGSSKAFCKCGEGWTCVITRTEGPDAGKTFFKCGGNCCCIIEADGTVTKAEDLDNLPEELKNTGPADAYCKCGEGWSCVVSRIEDPTPAAKPFYECAGSCSCVTE
ncbi:uncharacterized protein LOC107430595 [Ziziphus jujuba]|uniref:Uncharacterized protein LOC107430595 n=1 Tax=Ziziphus jujuba TaxID=326968 RepID=A0A6P4BD71_ZIZJJ|nr:uncharacterized protein LOC107430595 [Ziziphus jujuba]